jgi:hypothetical protein
MSSTERIRGCCRVSTLAPVPPHYGPGAAYMHKVKVKVTVKQAMKAQRRSRGIALLSL